MSYGDKLARYAAYVGRWPVALACVLVLAAALLLPALGSAGLWEPQERQLADKTAPRRELMKVSELSAPVHAAIAAALAPKTSTATPPVPLDESCLRAPPPDAAARSLTSRAMLFGRDVFGDSDAGRRLPLALLGLLTVLATFGIATRTAGPRAGLLASLVALSMPLLALQSRQLTSEIGTAAGGSLILYGLLALGTRAKTLAWTVIDSFVALAALAAGMLLAFMGGGALLGWIVPFGAFAAAGALGAPVVIGLVKSRKFTRFDAKALAATLVTLGVAATLAHELYNLVLLWDLEPSHPGALRAIGDHAIVPSRCWSAWLGALWKPEDDLRFIYDSTFEQIAYGTFPWGVLAPVAMFSLIASKEPRSRLLGALVLAWAGGAWIACEAFQRRVGFTIYPAFPAMAIAVGAWLDGVLAARARGDSETLPINALLVGTFVALAVLDLGKDVQSFTDHVTSLTVGADAIPYPPMAKLLWLPAKLWILILGMIVALGLAETFLLWRDKSAKLRRIAGYGTAVAFAGTAVLAAFWPYTWTGRISEHLSSKAMFDTIEELRGQGDQLVIMGDLGDAPHDYAPELKPEMLTTREQVVASLGRPNRVFAISPQTELCQLHRELSGKPYFVIDDRNTRSILLSNKVDGTTDKNPLATQIVHAEPKTIPNRPKGRVVFDSRIELLGWDIPKSVGKGDKFKVTVYYKVLQAVPGNWKVLFHFDGPLRFNGDHDPIGGRCQTSTWQQGDYIIDSYTVIAGGGTFTTGPYEVWTGFFTGTNPNWKNMPVSEAPGDLRDNADRVKITTILLE